MVDGEAYEYQPMGLYVVRAPAVCRNRPTFKYTRIEIAGILDRLANGETIDKIADGLDGYVPRTAIVEAIQIAARMFNSPTADHSELVVTR